MNGLSQFNVFLPDGVRQGLVPVRVEWHGDGFARTRSCGSFRPGRLVPRLVSVSDGVNLLSAQRIESG